MTTISLVGVLTFGDRLGAKLEVGGGNIDDESAQPMGTNATSNPRRRRLTYQLGRGKGREKGRGKRNGEKEREGEGRRKGKGEGNGREREGEMEGKRIGKFEKFE